MKKFIIVLLTLVLAFAMTFSLVACDEGDKNDDKEKEEENTTEPIPETTQNKEPVPTPEGYTLYNNGKISFAYPDTWKESDGILADENSAVNNITVTFEQKSDIYINMDVESFNSTLKPAFEQAGLTVTDPSVEQLTNDNDTRITKICCTTAVYGVTMKQTMLIVAVGDLNYVITVTEVTPDAALVENVYKTLDIIE